MASENVKGSRQSSDTQGMATVIVPQTRMASRAVLHPIRPGNMATCAACDQAVKFASRDRRHQVIANVYVDGSWDRVEHYHPDCYEAVHQPYGTAET